VDMSSNGGETIRIIVDRRLFMVNVC
jgi:hypothetical protein